jgi:hypothetical protein
MSGVILFIRGIFQCRGGLLKLGIGCISMRS